MDRQVRSLPPGTRTVYVRYSIEGLAIDDFRLAAISPAAGGGQLTITHVWREAGRPRTHVEKLASPGAASTYVVEAGRQVTPEALVIECR